MPNGFYGRDEEWKKLEAPLLELDNYLVLFADTKKIQIEKNYHNWPSRALQWETKGINRQIQIYLENEKQKIYNFWLCAYQDKDNEQFWKNEFLKKSVLLPEIVNSLGELLEKSYDIVNSWAEEDLEKTR